MKRTKYISLVTSALLAVSPVITTSLTTSSVVNAAKTTYAKKHVKKTAKKHSKKVAKKSVKKSTKKAAKKSKGSKLSKIFDNYSNADPVSKQIYRKAYNNRYTHNKKQYVDVKANKAHITVYSDDGYPIDDYLQNKAGEVFRIYLPDLTVNFLEPETGVHTFSVGGDGDSDISYNTKDFTIIPHTGGTKKNLANMDTSSN